MELIKDREYRLDLVGCGITGIGRRKKLRCREDENNHLSLFVLNYIVL